MITINITTDGEITISSESAGERVVMTETYLGSEQEGTRSPETELDEIKAEYFKQGWDAATREAMLNFVAGKIVEFFQESGVSQDVSETAFAEERDSDQDREIWPGRDGVIRRIEDERSSDIRPAKDSGEPELEGENKTWDPSDSGTWTMSSEELQSRLDEAYRRGRFDKTSDTIILQTTERSLAMMVTEINAELWPDGYGVASKRDILLQFGIVLARRMGIEVSA